MNQDELKRLLRYDPDSGEFFWLVNRTNGVKAGDRAGALTGPTGYRLISLMNKTYRAHRLAFLYMTGRDPEDCLDHVNGLRYDNRWCNLREANNSQNQHNRRGTGSNCGVKNVTYVPSRGKFQVSMKVSGKERFIGYFDDLEAATLVATEARERLHGNFAKHC